MWRDATAEGWAERASARAAQTGFKKGVSNLGVDPHGLEVLAGRSDAVDGIPLVAHLLIDRLRTGHVGVRQGGVAPATGAKRMFEVEGLFRISGEAEEVTARAPPHMLYPCYTTCSETHAGRPRWSGERDARRVDGRRRRRCRRRWHVHRPPCARRLAQTVLSQAT